MEGLEANPFFPTVGRFPSTRWLLLENFLKSFWYRKLYMKSVYNSKVFENITNFFVLFSMPKTVSIVPDQNELIHPILL